MNLAMAVDNILDTVVPESCCLIYKEKKLSFQIEIDPEGMFVEGDTIVYSESHEQKIGGKLTSAQSLYSFNTAEYPAVEFSQEGDAFIFKNDIIEMDFIFKNMKDWKLCVDKMHSLF